MFILPTRVRRLVQPSVAQWENGDIVFSPVVIKTLKLKLQTFLLFSQNIIIRKHVMFSSHVHVIPFPPIVHPTIPLYQ